MGETQTLIFLVYPYRLNSDSLDNSEKGALQLKTVKGSGLAATVLTILHGLYVPLHFLWVLVLTAVGLSSLVPPFPNPIVLAILDTIVYLFIGVGMLRGKSYFVFATVWSIWGAVLSTFADTYQVGVPNLLSFLIVLSCVHYHVSNNKTNSQVAKKVGQFAAILAIMQGIIVASAFTFMYVFYFEGWIILVPPLDQPFLLPSLVATLATAVAYLAFGVGMLTGKEEFFFLAIFWTIVESALAVADSSYLRTHYNIISIFLLAFATYFYFAKTKTR